MSAKKILAGFFALITLIKLVALLTYPTKWLDLGKVVMEHQAILTGFYLVLLVITGYYIFTSLKLIDLVLVMFFTALLIGLSLLPYSNLLLTITQEVATVGIGKTWPAMLIWGAICVAVLFQVFSKRRS